MQASSRFDVLYGSAVIQPSPAVVAIEGAAFWPPWRCWLADQWEMAYDALLVAGVVVALKVLLS